MTRKDYVLIAAALNKAEPHCDESGPLIAWRECVDSLADALERDNPRFDRGRFLKAAGVQS